MFSSEIFEIFNNTYFEDICERPLLFLFEKKACLSYRINIVTIVLLNLVIRNNKFKKRQKYSLGDVLQRSPPENFAKFAEKTLC